MVRDKKGAIDVHKPTRFARADLFACGTDNQLRWPPMFKLIIASFLVCGGPTAVGIDRPALFTHRRLATRSQSVVSSGLVIYTFGEGRVCVFSPLRQRSTRFLNLWSTT